MWALGCSLKIRISGQVGATAWCSVRVYPAIHYSPTRPQA